MQASSSTDPPPPQPHTGIQQATAQQAGHQVRRRPFLPIAWSKVARLWTCMAFHSTDKKKPAVRRPPPLGVPNGKRNCYPCRQKARPAVLCTERLLADSGKSFMRIGEVRGFLLPGWGSTTPVHAQVTEVEVAVWCYGQFKRHLEWGAPPAEIDRLGVAGGTAGAATETTATSHVRRSARATAAGAM